MGSISPAVDHLGGVGPSESVAIARGDVCDVAIFQTLDQSGAFDDLKHVFCGA
jgi:hypothetical protein